MTMNKTNCDWLLDMSVRQPLGSHWPLKLLWNPNLLPLV